MVPGFGPFHGITGRDLIREAKAIAPGLADELDRAEVMFGDMDWLKSQKMTL